MLELSFILQKDFLSDEDIQELQKLKHIIEDKLLNDINKKLNCLFENK